MSITLVIKHVFFICLVETQAISLLLKVPIDFSPHPHQRQIEQNGRLV